ncbi:MAG: hypothetical protein ACXVP0_05105 [Bacteroidia bacterium]
MKRLIVTITALGISYLSSAQSGVEQSTLSPNPPTNTVIPGGGYPEDAARRDKTLVNDTPENIVMQFNRDYPGNSDATWTQEGKNYRAVYTDPQTKLPRAIIYDREGNVVRTENQMDDIYSPAGVNEYYSKYHPNQKFKVWKSEEQNGRKAYYTQHNGETTWFDENGNYIQGNKKSNTSPTSPKSSNTSPSDNTKKGGQKNSGTKTKSSSQAPEPESPGQR